MFNAYEVDMIVMAGWMKVVSKKFCDEFAGRIINLHPSLLPKYKGLHAVEQALKAGEEETGCTVHFVNEKLDGGRIITQKSFYIMSNFNEFELKKRTQNLEHIAYPEAIVKISRINY